MNFFPPSIGLDISETSVKAVSLKKGEGELFDVVAFGRGYLEPGAVADGEIKNSELFLKTLQEVLEREKSNFPKTRYMVAAVPEAQAFLRILELPSALKNNELTEALKYEVEANIPLALDEVYYDYEILDHSDAAGHRDIMVNAVPKKIADGYVDFFGRQGYQLLALEIESVAASRALFPKSDAKESVLVLDIGATKTRFMIVTEGMLRFTSSNNVAGNRFSHVLTEHFPLNLKEAEFMKRVVGLDKNQEKGRELLEVLRPELNMLKEQIQNYINFFETHPANHTFSENARKISKVVLTGGAAALWGLTDWLSQELHLVVILGNPLARVKIDPNSRVKMSVEDSLAYATALGLAMRNFDEA